MRKRMLQMMPDYYVGSGATGMYLDALSLGLSSLSEKIADRAAQLFIQTATWALPRYEKIFGITANSGTIEERRSRILARRASRGTCTIERIKQVAAAYTGGTVDVVEHSAESWVEIIFVDQLGRPTRMDDFTASLREILPAHLGMAFTYRYRTHGELRRYTHGTLTAYTHHELREEELI